MLPVGPCISWVNDYTNEYWYMIKNKVFQRVYRVDCDVYWKTFVKFSIIVDILLTFHMMEENMEKTNGQNCIHIFFRSISKVWSLTFFVQYISNITPISIKLLITDLLVFLLIWLSNLLYLRIHDKGWQKYLSIISLSLETVDRIQCTVKIN
jgi:hypothetical protein